MEEGHPIWRVAANILHNQSRKADKEGSPSLNKVLPTYGVCKQGADVKTWTYDRKIKSKLAKLNEKKPQTVYFSSYY
jgi:hypothetical protein